MKYYHQASSYQQNNNGYLSDLTEDSTEPVVDTSTNSRSNKTNNYHQIYEVNYYSDRRNNKTPIHVHHSPGYEVNSRILGDTNLQYHQQAGRNLNFAPKYQEERYFGSSATSYDSRVMDENINRGIGIVPSLKNEKVMIIANPNDKDILCGRGAPTNLHPGNQSFRKLTKQHQRLYLKTRRSDKPLIAMEILKEIKSDGGRFMKRKKQRVANQMMLGRYYFVWVELSEQQAYEKTCQALREGAPKIRHQMQQSLKVVCSISTTSKSNSTYRKNCREISCSDRTNRNEGC